jgi:hypothetical protein
VLDAMLDFGKSRVPKPLIEGLLGRIYLRFLVTREPLDDRFLVGLADWLVGRPPVTAGD